MIFSIRNLTFELGGMLLEGYAALTARFVCALLLLAAGWFARHMLIRKIFPELLARRWHFEATPILLRSFTQPVELFAGFTGLYFAVYSLPWAIPGFSKLITNLYIVAFIYCVCLGLYSASGLMELLLKSCSEPLRSNRTFSSLLVKLYKISVIIVGLFAVAQELGLPIGSIVAGAGLVGLTVSLAAQETASNLFSGLMILLERPFQIGDWIVVNDVEGTVEDINFRSTRVRALDNSIFILTNSQVCSSTINNCTSRTKRLYRFTLGVTYDTTRSQLEQLMADLTHLLKTSPNTYAEGAFVRLNGFGDSSIDLLVSAYLRTTDLLTFLNMQNDLNLDIMDVMEKNGVSFAFPSTSVYIENADSPSNPPDPQKGAKK
ncbi:MAG: mechanosensitive ion channel family protein [Faecalibacterium sp.]